MAKHKIKIFLIAAIIIGTCIIFYNQHNKTIPTNPNNEIPQVAVEKNSGNKSDCKHLLDLIKNVDTDNNNLKKDHDQTIKESESLKTAIDESLKNCNKPGQQRKCNASMMGMMQGQYAQAQGRLQQIANSLVESLKNKEKLLRELQDKKCEAPTEITPKQ